MASLQGSRVPPTSGAVTLAACDAAGSLETPILTTVFRAGRGYRGMEDTEIRGYLDGGVKFERNVATQYHVRIGCEASGAVSGKSEVMRVLQRWDVSAIPPYARVRAARLVLRQEDITRFPHRLPLRSPVTFYLYEVKKPWGPGRGGVDGNNVSKPEPGDAWWQDARAGELAWQVPGCGFGSDSDPRADRAAEPLAAGTVRSSADDLVFTGESLARRIEEAVRGGRSLDVLIAASAVDESLPGSIKAFYSRDYGDEGHPVLRPRLELDWTARALWVEERPFVLEPGGTAVFRPPSAGAAPGPGRDIILAASLRLDANDPGAIPPEVLAAGIEAGGGLVTEEGCTLAVPLRASPAAGFEALVTTAVQPVAAGDPVRFEVLETWSPSVRSPDQLAVFFRFTAPSGRTLERESLHAGGHRYICEVQPDEMGVWRYSWATSPDARFRPHEGSGWFTVVRRKDGGHLTALGGMADAAVAAAGRPSDLVSRKRTHTRLTALAREVHEFSRTEAPAADAARCHELLDAISGALGRCG